MNDRLREFPDRREWDLSEFTLDRLSFDYRTELLIAVRGRSLGVTIETPFILQTDGNIEAMDPEQSVSAARLLALLHHPLASLTAFRSGLLVIKFENGAEIRVPKDEQYESWQTGGEGKLDMLCSPHEGAPWVS